MPDCSRLLWEQERHARQVFRLAGAVVDAWDTAEEEADEWLMDSATGQAVADLRKALTGRPEQPFYAPLFGYSGSARSGNRVLERQ